MHRPSNRFVLALFALGAALAAHGQSLIEPVPNSCLDAECRFTLSRTGLSPSQLRQVFSSSPLTGRSFGPIRTSYVENPGDPKRALVFIRASHRIGKLPEALETIASLVSEGKSAKGLAPAPLGIAFGYGAALLARSRGVAEGTFGLTFSLPISDRMKFVLGDLNVPFRVRDPLWLQMWMSGAAMDFQTQALRRAATQYLVEEPRDDRGHEYLAWAYMGGKMRPTKANDDQFGPFLPDFSNTVRLDLAEYHARFARALRPDVGRHYLRLASVLYGHNRSASRLLVKQYLSLEKSVSGPELEGLRAWFPELSL